MESRLEKTIAKIKVLVVATAFLSLPSYAVEVFTTIKVWDRPRYFIFGRLDPERQRFFVWTENGRERPLRLLRKGECLPDAERPMRSLMNSSQFLAAKSNEGEVIRGSSGSWAIEIMPQESSFLVTFDQGGCVLFLNSQVSWSRGSPGAKARVGVSDGVHVVAGRQVFVEEDVFVAGVYYRVQAEMGLKWIRLSDNNYFSPSINAGMEIRSPILFDTFAEFEISQSLISFLVDVSFSSWAAKIGKSFSIAWLDGLWIDPFLKLERDFVLTEQAISLPDGAQNIFAFSLGVKGHLDLLDKWSLAGELSTSLADLSGHSTRWKNVYLAGSAGYRFSPSLKLSATTRFKFQSNSNSESSTMGMVGSELEMEF